MQKMNQLAACAAVAAGGLLSVHSASAAVVTAWDFENISPITGTVTVVNNSPAPSAGVGTASSIGMDLYPTPNVGVTTDDVILGATGDTGTNGIADLGQIWRVRGQAGPSGGAANGWSSLAPIGTQGAVFAASTVGSTGINVSFDWYATNKGESNLQLEYTTDGVTFKNVAITVPAADTGVVALTNTSSPNTVIGSYLSIAAAGGAGQNWFPSLTATITDPAAANDPNFAIELVNASTGADNVSATNAALNNSSGNWRFDNVSINGSSVPEPTSLGLIAVTGLGLLARRRRMA